MEQKKSRKADLEGKRNTFFLVGLVLSLGLVLMAFEWSAKPQKAILSGGIPVDIAEDVYIPNTREHKETPPPPKIKPIEEFIIVDNTIDVGDPAFEETEPLDEIPIDLPMFTDGATKEPEEQIFVNNIQIPAEFPGGERALYRYISDHVKYPAVAQENGIEGKVYVQFVVDEKGNIVNAHVTRQGDFSLDAEALRVINSLPRFKPGMQAGKYVKVYYTAVINFQLQ